MLSLLQVLLSISTMIAYTSTPTGSESNTGLPSMHEEEAVLDNIRLPDGFHIEYYAKDVYNARSMDYSPGGTLFVGSRAGNVYALLDEDGDLYAEKKILIDRGLNQPNGVALWEGDLYVADIDKILKYPNIEDELNSPPDPEIVSSSPVRRDTG